MDLRNELVDVQPQRPRAKRGADPARSDLGRAIVDRLDAGVIVLDRSGAAISANDSAVAILGVPRNAIVGRRPPFSGAHQVFLEDGRRVTAATDPALATLTDRVARREVLMHRFAGDAGETTWISASTLPLPDEGVLYTFADVTERRRAERGLREERDRAQRYLELAGAAIVVLDTEARITVLNRAGHELLGYAEGDLLGRDWFTTCVPTEERDSIREIFARCMSGEVTFDEETSENEVVTRTGERRVVSWTNSLMHDDHGRPSGILASGIDITDRRAAEQQVSFLAYHDGLTGLPNRALLEEHLRKGLARARRGGESVGLIFVDLDGFKLVNDSLGHASGDDVLREAAERLAMTTRASDLLARQGGDEFLLLLGDVARDKDPEEVAVAASKRILEALSEPFQVAGAEFQLGASIGIALYPRDAHDPDGLLKAADGAMYRAKRAGRGAYAFPEPDDAGDARARLSLTTRLRRALARDELELHFQPVYTVDTGELVSAEALLRWTDPTEGQIPPGVFVPVAEETGLMGALGDWVIERLCRHAREWADAGILRRLSFNLSPRQFHGGNVAERILSLVESHGLVPTDFCVEITESTAMTEHVRVEPQLRALHDAGFVLAIDDFGAGHSSLARLRDLPVDILKVDRSFLAAAPDDPQATAIVGAVLTLAAGLGMTTVAEGVETEAQHRWLRSAGCPLAQGFHLGRPVPFAAMTELLEARAGA